jgi:urease accessory protein
MLAGLLLLADSRLPSGGHVHSGGVEALVERGLLTGAEDLALFLDGRIRTAGLVVASVAAASAALSARSVHPPRDWRRWDAAVDVRTPSPALREASRAQGGALLRTVGQAWPVHPPIRELASLRRPHQPLVLGAAVVAAGGGPGHAAALAVHHLIGGAATSAVRLLGLDPLRVASIQAALAVVADATAAEAALVGTRAEAADEPDLLPSDATPLPEILAELHDHSEVTLFAS